MTRKPVIIKKYENRWLYDSTNSRYINQDEIARMIRDGESRLHAFCALLMSTIENPGVSEQYGDVVGDGHGSRSRYRIPSATAQRRGSATAVYFPDASSRAMTENDPM